MKAEWGVPSMVDMIHDLGSIAVFRKPIKCKSSWVWRSPALGIMKVNVDAFFFGNSGRDGIRGLIRDSEERVLIQFCKEVRMNFAIHARFLLFREGLLVVVASR